jgi:hypothetical protein
MPPYMRNKLEAIYYRGFADGAADTIKTIRGK